MSNEIDKIKFNPSPMSFPIHGIIRSVEEIKTTSGNHFYKNKIVCPAESPFEKPKPIEVNSDMPLGKPDAVIQQDVYVNIRFTRGDNNIWYQNVTFWDTPSKTMQ